MRSLAPSSLSYDVAMPTPDEHPLDRAGKRVLASVVALLLGLVGGLAVALLTVGFGEWFLPVAGAVMLGSAVLAWIVPGPFLFLGEVVLGIFTEVG